MCIRVGGAWSEETAVQVRPEAVGAVGEGRGRATFCNKLKTGVKAWET